MEENTGAHTEKKLSYEELKNIAGQLQQQNKMLVEQMYKARNEEMYKRIDYLFKVLENKDSFSTGFCHGVANEIEDVLTIEDQEEVKE